MNNALKNSFPLSESRLEDLTIDPVPQFPAWFEVRNTFLRHRHVLSGLRISASARGPVVDRERAKPTDLDAPALHQAREHGFEDGLDHSLGILGSE